MRLELSEQADADMAEILDFGVRNFEVSVGSAYYLSFGKSFARLRDYPRSESIRSDIRPDLWMLSHKRHCIFYEIDDKRILVLRVLHHARDVTLHFS